MNVFFVDPGPEYSGWCLTGVNHTVLSCGVDTNFLVLSFFERSARGGDVCGFELPVYYGAKAGGPLLRTAMMAGRLVDRAETSGYPLEEFVMPSRPQVLERIAGRAQAKKDVAWACMLERFGLPGTKKNPGKLFGVVSHARDAFEGCVYLRDALGLDADKDW